MKRMECNWSGPGIHERGMVYLPDKMLESEERLALTVDNLVAHDGTAYLTREQARELAAWLLQLAGGEA